MKKFISVLKLSIFASVICLGSLSVSAYQIKHGYSADNGMTYYGSCKNGKELMILESKDGSFIYEGPSSKGTLKKGADLDKAARKACGEELKS